MVGTSQTSWALQVRTPGEGVAHMYQLHLQWNPLNTDTLGPLKCVLVREVSSFQGANITYLYRVGTWSSVLIREVSAFQRCPLRGVPL